MSSRPTSGVLAWCSGRSLRTWSSRSWGRLRCRYAIRTLVVNAAQHSGHDPDRMSLVAALRIARQSIAPGALSP